MSRESRDLTNNNYDAYLASKAQGSRSARQELEQRKAERRNAHDSQGVGYHFGIADQVVKVESKEHLKRELDKRGLMLETDVNRELRGPGKHEFGGKKK
jgi:hypothetical protein